MEVSVRGSRSSARDWARAQSVPLEEIPALDEQQKAAARQMQVSEEDYARSAYAGQLSQAELLQIASDFGRWLNDKMVERCPGGQVVSVELDTWSEKLRVRVLIGTESLVFAVDEALVEQFLVTGSSALEKSLLRLLDIYLPRLQEAEAS